MQPDTAMPVYSFYAPFERFVAERPTPQAMRQRPSTTDLATNPFRLPPVGY